MTDLPRLGVATRHDSLPALASWIIEGDRAVEVQDFVMPAALDRDVTDEVARIRKLLDGHHGDLGIHGPFLGLDTASIDPHVQKVVTQRLLRGVEIAEALGGTHMVVHSPFNWWHELNHVNYPNIRPEMVEAACETLRPVVERADQIGCTVMLENIDDPNPLARAEVITMMDHPRLKASIDTGHAELAHRLYRGAPLVDHITQLTDMLGHVHLQDVDGHADRHWHPGDGVIAWGPVMLLLASLPKPPRLILEVRDEPERLPATVAMLNAAGLAS